ncbi:hypothetical protein ACPF04_06680 [Campylobacter sp. MOP51]|uniref:hypothetical protein n=1 Tax=Campylobacter canis TaxID=3378588 RepID=UPI003C34EB06
MTMMTKGEAIIKSKDSMKLKDGIFVADSFQSTQKMSRDEAMMYYDQKIKAVWSETLGKDANTNTKKMLLKIKNDIRFFQRVFDGRMSNVAEILRHIENCEDTLHISDYTQMIRREIQELRTFLL